MKEKTRKIYERPLKDRCSFIFPPDRICPVGPRQAVLFTIPATRPQLTQFPSCNYLVPSKSLANNSLFALKRSIQPMMLTDACMAHPEGLPTCFKKIHCDATGKCIRPSQNVSIGNCTVRYLAYLFATSCGNGEGFMYTIPQMSLKWTKMKNHGLKNFLFTLSNMAITEDLPYVEDCECLSYCQDEYGHKITQQKKRRIGDCIPNEDDPCPTRDITAPQDTGTPRFQEDCGPCPLETIDCFLRNLFSGEHKLITKSRMDEILACLALEIGDICCIMKVIQKAINCNPKALVKLLKCTKDEDECFDFVFTMLSPEWAFKYLSGALGSPACAVGALLGYPSLKRSVMPNKKFVNDFGNVFGMVNMVLETNRFPNASGTLKNALGDDREGMRKLAELRGENMANKLIHGMKKADKDNVIDVFTEAKVHVPLAAKGKTPYNKRDGGKDGQHAKECQEGDPSCDGLDGKGGSRRGKNRHGGSNDGGDGGGRGRGGKDGEKHDSEGGGHGGEGHGGRGHGGRGHGGEGKGSHKAEGHKSRDHSGEGHGGKKHEGAGTDRKKNGSKEHGGEGHKDKGHGGEKSGDDNDDRHEGGKHGGGKNRGGGHESKKHGGEGSERTGRGIKAHGGAKSDGSGKRGQGHVSKRHGGEGSDDDKGNAGKGHGGESHGGKGHGGEGHGGKGHGGEGKGMGGSRKPREKKAVRKPDGGKGAGGKPSSTPGISGGQGIKGEDDNGGKKSRGGKSRGNVRKPKKDKGNKSPKAPCVKEEEMKLGSCGPPAACSKIPKEPTKQKSPDCRRSRCGFSPGITCPDSRNGVDCNIPQAAPERSRPGSCVGRGVILIDPDRKSPQDAFTVWLFKEGIFDDDGPFPSSILPGDALVKLIKQLSPISTISKFSSIRESIKKVLAHKYFKEHQKSAAILKALDLLFKLETNMRDSQEIKVRQDCSKRIELICYILETLGHKAGSLPIQKCANPSDDYGHFLEKHHISAVGQEEEVIPLRDRLKNLVGQLSVTSSVEKFPLINKNVKELLDTHELTQEDKEPMVEQIKNMMCWLRKHMKARTDQEKRLEDTQRNNHLGDLLLILGHYNVLWSETETTTKKTRQFGSLKTQSDGTTGCSWTRGVSTDDDDADDTSDIDNDNIPHQRSCNMACMSDTYTTDCQLNAKNDRVEKTRSIEESDELEQEEEEPSKISYDESNFEISPDSNSNKSKDPANLYKSIITRTQESNNDNYEILDVPANSETLTAKPCPKIACSLPTIKEPIDKLLYNEKKELSKFLRGSEMLKIWKESLDKTSTAAAKVPVPSLTPSRQCVPSLSPFVENIEVGEPVHAQLLESKEDPREACSRLIPKHLPNYVEPKSEIVLELKPDALVIPVTSDVKDVPRKNLPSENWIITSADHELKVDPNHSYIDFVESDEDEHDSVAKLCPTNVLDKCKRLPRTGQRSPYTLVSSILSPTTVETDSESCCDILNTIPRITPKSPKLAPTIEESPYIQGPSPRENSPDSGKRCVYQRPRQSPVEDNEKNYMRVSYMWTPIIADQDLVENKRVVAVEDEVQSVCNQSRNLLEQKQDFTNEPSANQNKKLNMVYILAGASDRSSVQMKDIQIYKNIWEDEAAIKTSYDDISRDMAQKMLVRRYQLGLLETLWDEITEFEEITHLHRFFILASRQSWGTMRLMFNKIKRLIQLDGLTRKILDSATALLIPNIVDILIVFHSSVHLQEEEAQILLNQASDSLDVLQWLQIPVDEWKAAIETFGFMNLQPPKRLIDEQMKSTNQKSNILVPAAYGDHLMNESLKRQHSIILETKYSRDPLTLKGIPAATIRNESMEKMKNEVCDRANKKNLSNMVHDLENALLDQGTAPNEINRIKTLSSHVVANTLNVSIGRKFKGTKLSRKSDGYEGVLLSRRFKKIIDRDDDTKCDIDECKKIFLKTFSELDHEEKFDNDSIKSDSDSTTVISMKDTSFRSTANAVPVPFRSRVLSVTEEYLENSWDSSMLNRRPRTESQARAARLQASQTAENKLIYKLHTNIIHAADDICHNESSGSVSNSQIESMTRYLPKIPPPSTTAKRITEKELNASLVNKSPMFWKWLSSEFSKLPGVEAKGIIESNQLLKLPRIDIEIPVFAFKERRQSLTNYSHQYRHRSSSIEQLLTIEKKNGTLVLQYLRVNSPEEEFSNILSELNRETLSKASVERLQEAFSAIKMESPAQAKTRSKYPVKQITIPKIQSSNNPANLSSSSQPPSTPTHSLASNSVQRSLNILTQQGISEVGIGINDYLQSITMLEEIYKGARSNKNFVLKKNI